MVHSVVQVCLYIIRLCHLLLPLLLRTADEKARSRAPTLRKPSPPQGWGSWIVIRYISTIIDQVTWPRTQKPHPPSLSFFNHNSYYPHFDSSHYFWWIWQIRRAQSEELCAPKKIPKVPQKNLMSSPDSRFQAPRSVMMRIEPPPSLTWLERSAGGRGVDHLAGQLFISEIVQFIFPYNLTLKWVIPNNILGKNAQ